MRSSGLEFEAEHGSDQLGAAEWKLNQTASRQQDATARAPFPHWLLRSPGKIFSFSRICQVFFKLLQKLFVVPVRTGERGEFGNSWKWQCQRWLEKTVSLKTVLAWRFQEDFKFLNGSSLKEGNIIKVFTRRKAFCCMELTYRWVNSSEG